MREYLLWVRYIFSKNIDQLLIIINVPLSEVGGKEGRNSGGKFGRIRRKGDSEDMVMKKR